MKKSKIIFFIIICIYFSINQSFSDTKTISKKTWYKLYKERVENFCKEYKNTDDTSELIYRIDESSYFKDLDNKDFENNTLEITSMNYKKVMNSIYSCAININFKRQLTLIKNDLISRNAELNSKLSKSIQKKKNDIDKKVKKLKWTCKINTNKKNNIIKKSVLKQTTYELCKYSYYLEYLKEKSKEINAEKWESISSVANSIINKNINITKEIESAYRSFTIVFQSYSDFENNIGTHILLELIKEDYYIFRKELHKTLNPINQVVYKIANAMRK